MIHSNVNMYNNYVTFWLPCSNFSFILKSFCLSKVVQKLFSSFLKILAKPFNFLTCQSQSRASKRDFYLTTFCYTHCTPKKFEWLFLPSSFHSVFQIQSFDQNSNIRHRKAALNFLFCLETTNFITVKQSLVLCFKDE